MPPSYSTIITNNSNQLISNEPIQIQGYSNIIEEGNVPPPEYEEAVQNV